MVGGDQHGAARCRCGRTAATSCSARRSSTTSRRTATWSPTAAPSWPSDGRMLAYRHRGFWQPTDTVKERHALEAAYQRGDRPWMLWDGARRARPPCRPRSRPCTTPASSADAQPAARAPRPDRCCSARTATTSPSAPAARCSSCAARTRASRSTALVLTGGGIAREEEERAALAAFCPGARAASHRAGPAGRALPARWERAKRALEELRAHGEPDLIFAPVAARRPPGPPHARRAGAHRVPRPPRARLRDPQVGRRPRPARPSTCRSPSRCCREKVAMLHEHYGSQRDRTWFDARGVPRPGPHPRRRSATPATPRRSTSPS